MLRLPFAFLVAFAVGAASDPFIAKPYLQLGDAPKAAKQETMTLVWHAADSDANWSTEVRKPGGKWVAQPVPTFRRVAVKDIEPHRVYASVLSRLKPGAEFQYRVIKGVEEVFSAEGTARKSAKQPYRFAVFGDCGAGTKSQGVIAERLYEHKPDFVFTTGDIVYSNGRISEYRQKFFPVYNSEKTPLTRSTLLIAAPGNHDLSRRDLKLFPDSLAYFYYWNQPLNGPLTVNGAPNSPVLNGPPDENQAAFLRAAKGTYPQMSNFSFDYGNAHWTVLDSNRYSDWTDAGLQRWLIADLQSARRAAWRFVAFHHPGLHSSKAHAADQWMRVLSPIFEQNGVDIVFAGHVHNYQRSKPLRFAPSGGIAKNGAVEGEVTLDQNFDGKTNTRAQGVVYIVTGAGGAGLYDPGQEHDPASWKPFTEVFKSNQHSVTIADMEGKRVSIRQVSEDGTVLDSFTITK